MLRQAQLPADGAIGVVVLENAHSGDNRGVTQITFLGVVGVGQRNAVPAVFNGTHLLPPPSIMVARAAIIALAPSQ